MEVHEDPNRFHVLRQLRQSEFAVFFELNLTPDSRVLAFTLGVTVITALLFGLLPAFRTTRLEFAPALKDGRGSSSVSARGVMARSLIVVIGVKYFSIRVASAENVTAE